MPKPLSEKIPSIIRSRLQSLGYASLKDFADHLEMPVSTVRNLLQRNRHTSIANVYRLSMFLGISFTDTVDLIETGLIKSRGSLDSLAKSADLSSSTLHHLVAGGIPAAVRNYLRILQALNIEPNAVTDIAV
ncbi:MAG: helix-turn-helix domain-containing protein [Candidatus Obscuribacterales bacterium]|nr:helix-turn-helix domain-containing protein [Candidatus Obscuribacterales bacterium]